METEVSVAENFDDIGLCCNLVSAEKITCARVLAECGQISEVAVNAEVVAALAAGMTGSFALLRALVQCDRTKACCGAQSPEPARDLGRLVAKASGLRVGGLMTYPKRHDELRIKAFLADDRDLCLQYGQTCAVIFSGGTPSLGGSTLSYSVKEYRSKAYPYNERLLVSRGICAAAP